ncbi:MAG TPA: undecaprenyl-diphosphate phosphatase, partial [Chloroflexota bacterium]|nr:undecaprenyl-diphosphate phosphatase [Chloroflexota bacterium]
MTWFQTIFLAILQGVSELFPVSSLGHTVVITRLAGWQEFEANPNFLPYVVLLHVGTATALLVFFWRDWVRIIRALIRTAIVGRIDADPHGRLAWLVVAGTIPAGLIGLFLEQPLKQLFASPTVAATFLAVNGILMIGGERLRRRSLATAGAAVRPDGGSLEVARPGQSVLEAAPDGKLPLERLTLISAVLVGLAQALALIPGISRSGVTMVAGLLV